MFKKAFPNFLKSFVADTKVYLFVLIVFTLLLGLHSIFWLIPGIFSLIILYWYAKRRLQIHRLEIDKHVDFLISELEQSTFQALQEVPLGAAIFNAKGYLIWHNDQFYNIFPLEKITSLRLDTIIPELSLGVINAEPGEKKINIMGKTYLLTYKTSPLKEQEEPIFLIYLQDITTLEHLIKDYENEKLAIAYIQIDNLNDALQGMSDGQRSTVLAEVNKLVGAWIAEFGGVYKRHSEDTYFVTLDKEALLYLMQHKFDILDRIRENKGNNKTPLTLSIGIATDEDSVFETGQKAQSCLDIALGRGGDQAAVSINGAMQFFGGKTTALEKNTRVRARIIAHTLQDLIAETDIVFIMGHINEDYDSLGSAIGVAKMAHCLRKPVHIITSGQGVSLSKCAELLPEYHEYDNVFISGAQAVELVTPHSLLFVVDHHRASLSAAPEILELASKKIIIDHHRRAEDIIRDTLIVYLEPSSSSTSELVTELLYYFENLHDFSRLEASLLYAGIVVDTKNFAVQTGARTFEAAAALRKAGADPNMVRQLFSEDLATAKARAQLISSATIQPGGVVISCCELLDIPAASVAIAQSADILLQMEGVICSVVIANIDKETTLVSARSLGKINVQIVMEELGGGGHQTVAGVQLKQVQLATLKEQIIALIQKQLEECKKNESNPTTRS